LNIYTSVQNSFAAEVLSKPPGKCAKGFVASLLVFLKKEIVER
jgi:hypothetical protein